MEAHKSTAEALLKTYEGEGDGSSSPEAGELR